MKRVAVRAGGEQEDHPLDLPPPTEMDDIADIPATIGARRRLVSGVNPEPRDQIGRVGCRPAVRKMDVLLHRFPHFFLLGKSFRGDGFPNDRR
jgi:hypothetical protein